VNARRGFSPDMTGASEAGGVPSGSCPPRERLPRDTCSSTGPRSGSVPPGFPAFFRAARRDCRRRCPRRPCAPWRERVERHRVAGADVSVDLLAGVADRPVHAGRVDGAGPLVIGELDQPRCVDLVPEVVNRAVSHQGRLLSLRLGVRPFAPVRWLRVVNREERWSRHRRVRFPPGAWARPAAAPLLRRKEIVAVFGPHRRMGCTATSEAILERPYADHGFPFRAGNSPPLQKDSAVRS